MHLNSHQQRRRNAIYDILIAYKKGFLILGCLIAVFVITSVLMFYQQTSSQVWYNPNRKLVDLRNISWIFGFFIWPILLTLSIIVSIKEIDLDAVVYSEEAINTAPTVLKLIRQHINYQHKDTILIYQKIHPLIKPFEQHSDTSEEALIELQEFKIKVAMHWMETSNYTYAKNILKEVIKILDTIPTVQNGYLTLHRALLGLLKCEVYLKNPIAAEIIVKKRIDINAIKEQKYFNQLAQESNRMYWGAKFNWITFVGIVILVGCIILEAVAFMKIQPMPRILWLIGLIPFLTGKILCAINQDYFSIDPFEVSTIKNNVRASLNARYNWNLGYQPELQDQELNA